VGEWVATAKYAAMLGPPSSARHIAQVGEGPPKLSHAGDYRWLTGLLIQEAQNGSWAIRYATPEEKDLHGGVMELLSTGPMAGFYPGQMVRVEGGLVDPKPFQIRPAYLAHSIEAVR
jgi:hypothetical protein